MRRAAGWRTMTEAHTDAAKARAVAAQVIVQVIDQGRLLDATLENALAALDRQRSCDAPLIQEMAYGTLRWAEQLEWIGVRLLDRPLRSRDRDVSALLLVGLYQLMHMRVPAYAVVSETVGAAEHLGKPWSRALLNGCLRKFLRNKDTVLDEIRQDPSAATSHPRWLLGEICEAWPHHWRLIVEANNQHPPMTLRVNVRESTRDAYLARLRDAGLAAKAAEHTDSGVTLDMPIPVAALPGFNDGNVSVQDAAAQLAGVLLDVRSGDRVLDACAAPGGKLTHILERYPDVARIVALEKEPARVALIEDNLARLRLNAEVIVGDAGGPAAWWDGELFNRILVDAPCSASGVIRRHPDIKVHRTRDDLAKLADIQGRILEGVWPLLECGGKLLYVTCSVLPAENEQQLGGFLARHADALPAALSVPVGIERGVGVQILPGEKDMDGFYYACLQKT